MHNYYKNRYHIGFLFIIILVNVALHSHVKNFGITIDDAAYFFSNKYMYLPWKDIWIAFLPGVVIDAVYTPLTLLISFILFKLFYLNPASYHVFNFVVYILTALLVYIFYYSHFKNKIKALTGALLFSVLPVHTEVIYWICANGYIFSVFFLMLCLILFNFIMRQDLKIEKNRVLLLCAFYIFYLSALLCQPTAIVFPFLLLVYAFYFKRNCLKKVLKMSSVLFVFSLIYGFFMFLGTDSSRYSAETTLLLGKKIVLAVKSLISLFVFYDYSPVYPMPDFYNPDIFVTIFSLILAGLLVYFFVRIKSRMFRFFLLWFVFSYVLYSHLFFGSTILTAQRYMYLASIGSVMFLTDMIYLIVKKIKSVNISLSNIMYVLLPVIILSYYSYSTYLYSFAWKNELATWSYAYNKYPDDHIINFTLGMKKAQMGDLKEAVRLFERTVEIFPEYRPVYKYLSKALQDTGRYEDSLKPALAFEKITGGDAETDRVLLNAYYIAGDYDKASERLKKLIHYIDAGTEKWDYSLLSLAVGILMGSGEADSAPAILTKAVKSGLYNEQVAAGAALQIEGSCASACSKYSAYLSQAKETDIILPQFIRICKMKQKYDKQSEEKLRESVLETDIAAKYAASDDFNNAETILHKVLEADPYNIEAQNLLCNIYLRLNDREKLNSALKKKRLLNPSDKG